MHGSAELIRSPKSTGHYCLVSSIKPTNQECKKVVRNTNRRGIGIVDRLAAGIGQDFRPQSLLLQGHSEGEGQEWNLHKETFDQYAIDKLALMHKLELPVKDTIHLLCEWDYVEYVEDRSVVGKGRQRGILPRPDENHRRGICKVGEEGSDERQETSEAERGLVPKLQEKRVRPQGLQRRAHVLLL